MIKLKTGNPNQWLNVIHFLLPFFYLFTYENCNEFCDISISRHLLPRLLLLICNH